MTQERTYNDEEIREIFRRATEAAPEPPTGRQAGSSERGMSLQELQEIGSEAGIAPEQVARAAAHLEGVLPRTAPPAPVKVLGVPVSVSHAVDLPGPLDERAWARLVVQLQETFNARGRAVSEGPLQSWRNGNLQIQMEPTERGYRLRMGSRSGEISGRLGGGLAMAAMAAIPAVIGPLLGLTEPGFLVGMGSVMALGAGLFVSGVVGARRWISRRRSQFQDIGVVARSLAAPGAHPQLPEGPPAGAP